MQGEQFTEPQPSTSLFPPSLPPPFHFLGGKKGIFFFAKGKEEEEEEQGKPSWPGLGFSVRVGKLTANLAST